MRARTAPVLDNNQKLTALIDVAVASEGEVVFEGIVGQPVRRPGSWLIHVAEGTGQIKITIPGCKMIKYIFPESPAIQSGMVYLLDIDLEAKDKLRTLIMPVVTHDGSQPSFGLMLGLCKKHGLYLKTEYDFGFQFNPFEDHTKADAEGMVDGVKGWFTGQSALGRLSFSGGYLGQPLGFMRRASLYSYAGGGYGARTLVWELYSKDGSYEYAEVVPSTFKGIVAETGLLYRLGGLALSLGVQTIRFEYLSVNVGLGLMF
ncbi:MAG: hypothetical protein J6N54_09695 [Bacteroidales bacterium]|nr:hypothetical protein [Bacteroidales bacterium]